MKADYFQQKTKKTNALLIFWKFNSTMVKNPPKVQESDFIPNSPYIRMQPRVQDHYIKIKILSKLKIKNNLKLKIKI